MYAPKLATDTKSVFCILLWKDSANSRCFKRSFKALKCLWLNIRYNKTKRTYFLNEQLGQSSYSSKLVNTILIARKR